MALKRKPRKNKKKAYFENCATYHLRKLPFSLKIPHHLFRIRDEISVTVDFVRREFIDER